MILRAIYCDWYTKTEQETCFSLEYQCTNSEAEISKRENKNISLQIVSLTLILRVSNFSYHIPFRYHIDFVFLCDFFSFAFFICSWVSWVQLLCLFSFHFFFVLFLNVIFLGFVLRGYSFCYVASGKIFSSLTMRYIVKVSNIVYNSKSEKKCHMLFDYFLISHISRPLCCISI